MLLFWCSKLHQLFNVDNIETLNTQKLNPKKKSVLNPIEFIWAHKQASLLLVSKMNLWFSDKIKWLQTLAQIRSTFNSNVNIQLLFYNISHLHVARLDIRPADVALEAGTSSRQKTSDSPWGFSPPPSHCWSRLWPRILRCTSLDPTYAPADSCLDCWNRAGTFCRIYKNTAETISQWINSSFNTHWSFSNKGLEDETVSSLL